MTSNTRLRFGILLSCLSCFFFGCDVSTRDPSGCACAPTLDAPAPDTDTDAPFLEPAADTAADAVPQADLGGPDWSRHEAFYPSPTDTWIIATDLDGSGGRRIVEAAPVPGVALCERGQRDFCTVTRHFGEDGTFQFVVDTPGGFLPEPGRTCQTLVGTRVAVFFGTAAGQPASMAYPVDTVAAINDAAGTCRFTIRRNAGQLPSPTLESWRAALPQPWTVVAQSSEPMLGMTIRFGDGSSCATDQASLPFASRWNDYYNHSCIGAPGNRTVRVLFTGTGMTRHAPCDLGGAGRPLGTVLSATNADGAAARTDLTPIGPPDAEGWCTYGLERH